MWYNMILSLLGVRVMKIEFIRHGQSNYTNVIKKHCKGFGLELAEISEIGVTQAKKVSNSTILQDADLILSSPYTRAMQTAAIISKTTLIDLQVEHDLHEWIPDLSFKYSIDTYHESQEEFYYNMGIYNENCKHRWEEKKSVFDRVCKTLNKYLDYKKIIVITHGLVIRQFVNSHDGHINNCQIYEIEFNEGFQSIPFNRFLYDDLLNKH